MSQLLLAWKNVTRKPLRFILTNLSILVAFFLFTILSGIDTALMASINSSSQQRLITSHKVSLTHSLPLKYQTQINTLEQVKRVTYASWFGGFFRNEKNQLAQFAVNNDNYFEIFSQYIVTPSQLESWKENRIGLVIGQVVADKFDWKVGDRVPIQSSIWMNKDDSFTWEFEVSAIYQTNKLSTDANQVFMNHRYFDEYRSYMGFTASWFTVETKLEANIATLSESIDQLFANSPMETKTTSEQVFLRELAQQFIDMSFLLKVVLSAVFFTLLLIACNTMIQSIRERMNEIAMMKAIGFSSTKLISNTFLESMILLTIGTALGTLFALLCLGLVRQQFAEFLPGIEVLGQHYLMVLLYMISFGCVCTLFPAIQIKQLAISQTLGSKI